MTVLPKDLIQNLQKGRVVLFLGAGASIGAKHPNGDKALKTEQLASLLADNFLGPEFSSRPLANIAELSISESDLFRVQEFIANIFLPFEPSDFHKIIPKLKWKAIASTNFDLIVERAYEQAKEPLQKLKIFTKNGQRVNLDETCDLLFLKLHGCINDIYDESTPLILSTDQYVNFRKNRSRLFDRLRELFYEFPFVFAGYSLQDIDLRTIMMELTESGFTSYPRSYLVSPDLSAPDIRFFETKRISHINAKFEDFLREVDAAVPSHFRVLMALQDSNEHPIHKKLKLTPGQELPPSLMTLINRDVDFVNPNISPTEFDVKFFYKGYFPDWTPIIIDLDVPRGITKKLLEEVILESLDKDPTLPEFFILKGPAGSGKSTVLRRLAWETAKQFNFICLWLKRGQLINYDALIELHRLTDERIFLFIDPTTEYVQEIQNIMLRSLKDKLPITIISAEREHEWNIDCYELEPYLTKEFKLYNLNEDEIDKLIDLLKKHDSLGYLKGLPIDKQRELLKQDAGRQLLVALHEATLGKPFGEIILDEYESITPVKARSLYLTVCIFHRLGVPVRAGLISRVHQIPFSMFEEDLFAPLESVVFNYFDQKIQDHVYLSRHSHIAEMVFSKVLDNSQDRLDEYMRVIAEIDYDYSSDREAFHGIVKARELLDLFPDPKTIRDIYERANNRVGKQPWLLQQEAIFEMNSDGGSFDKAYQLLEQARKLSPNDRLIMHSLSELSLKRSEKSNKSIERSKFRDDARKQVKDLLHSGNISSYPYHTLIKTNLAELKDLIKEGDDPFIGRAIKQLQETIVEATQKYPEDPFLASAESEFMQIINENEKALNALSRAFNANKGSPFIALRLANIYEAKGEIDEAINVIKLSLEIKPDSKPVNFKLATLLQKKSETNLSTLKHYLNRSFTEGDSNYTAQFEYARVLFLDQDYERARKIFEQLKFAKIDSRIKDKPRGIVKSQSGNELEFTGSLVNRESTYGFIRRDQYADEIFTHQSYSERITWNDLYPRMRLRFNLAFNYKGPIAINVRIE